MPAPCWPVPMSAPDRTTSPSASTSLWMGRTMLLRALQGGGSMPGGVVSTNSLRPRLPRVESAP